jgi:hypothetical protein
MAVMLVPKRGSPFPLLSDFLGAPLPDYEIHPKKSEPNQIMRDKVFDKANLVGRGHGPTRSG